MKDKKKIIVPLLLAGVTATGVVSNISQVQQVSVQAETTGEITDVVGAEIKVSRFQALNSDNTSLEYRDTFKVGDRVYLPKVTLDSDSGLTSSDIVYTIKKDKKEFTPESDEKGFYFVANYQGYYDVTISAKKDNKVTTTLTNLSVFVERDEATIKLPTNSEYVIPAKVAKEQEGLKIPAPTVVYEKDGKEVEEKAKELTTGTLSVYLVTPTSGNVSLELDSTGSYYEVTDKTKLATVGTYQIVYEYKKGTAEEKVISRLESNFQVVNNYDSSAIKLKMVFKSKLSEKGTVNTDVSIPRVDVVDENVSSSDAINAYVKVTVKNMNTGKEYAVDYDNYTFHPTEEGSYSVKYQAFIGLFGDDCKTIEVSPGSPMVISDSEAPKVIPTYKYTFDEDGEIDSVNDVTISATSEKTQREVAEEKLVNRKVDIPSAVVVGEEFTIPAAYATDNFYTYSNQNDDIVITRTYRSSGGAISTVSASPNENATIKFETAGTAEIRYQATDKKGNTLGEVVYDLTVYSSADELKDGETSLKLDVGTTLITDKEKTLTFAKPTATDTYDKNVDVKTYLVKGTYSASSASITEDNLLTETNSDGKYVIDIEKLVSEGITEFTIVARAYVDDTLVGTRDSLTSTLAVEKTQTVTIQETSADNEAPTFSIVDGSWNEKLFAINNGADDGIIADSNGSKIGTDGYLKTSSDGYISISSENPDIHKAPFDQGSSILKIPAVKFTDNKDSNLSISVEIRDRKGNLVDKYNQESVKRTISGTTYNYEVSGASFKLSSYGMYTVTFKAQDYAGNIVIKSYGIRVNDKTAPTITILDEDKFNKEIEVGEYFEVPTATLMKEGEDISSTSTSRWEIYNVSAGADYVLYNKGFIPKSEGTFLIRYYGDDGLGNETLLEDSLFTITAKDTIAPTIDLDLTEYFDTNIAWSPAENTEYMDINIPVAFATDKNRGQVEVTYTVTGPNNVKPTVKDNEEHEYLKTFRATAEGKYTVVYSAVDEAGNESKIEKVICVGDCVAPTITWINKNRDLPKEIKLNEEYVFDIGNFLKLEDNDERNTEDSLIENVTITLTSPDGTSVTNKFGNGNGYKWEFTQTGNYTLKISVKDEVGNTTTETYTINVPSEEAETNKVSPVLGTVLVVLSVVVLGGVVVYFIASNKKKTTKKSSSKKK